MSTRTSVKRSCWKKIWPNIWKRNAVKERQNVNTVAKNYLSLNWRYDALLSSIRLLFLLRSCRKRCCWWLWCCFSLYNTSTVLKVYNSRYNWKSLANLAGIILGFYHGDPLRALCLTTPIFSLSFPFHSSFFGILSVNHLSPNCDCRIITGTLASLFQWSASSVTRRISLEEIWRHTVIQRMETVRNPKSFVLFAFLDAKPQRYFQQYSWDDWFVCCLRK